MVFQIFMRPEFALNDPATFNAVLPWSHFNSAGGKSSRDVASSKLLQEKVTDCREQTLLNKSVKVTRSCFIILHSVNDSVKDVDINPWSCLSAPSSSVTTWTWWRSASPGRSRYAQRHSFTPCLPSTSCRTGCRRRIELWRSCGAGPPPLTGSCVRGLCRPSAPL